jgi:cytochrome b6-f complex iron-sulfur subunit
MSKNSVHKKAQTETSRRTFLTKLWIGLGLIGLAEFVAVAFAFLRSKKSEIREENFAAVFTAGPVDRFTAGSVTAFVRGRFYLARLEDGGFLALSRKCTHLGCTVPWVGKDRKFACPCHASAFDIRGQVISPPAPRPLDLYPIVIENGIIKVDTSKPIKRNEFKISQVVQP